MARRPRSPSSEGDSAYGRIYAVVRRIPRGHVASYGQVAELAGIPEDQRKVWPDPAQGPVGP